MRTIILSLLLCFLLVGTVSAQEAELSPYEIALQRIEEARVSGATGLSLYDLGLSELPPEIGNLRNLLSLSLSKNSLSSLPSEIGNLSNLQWLNVSDNQLASLPPEIGNLHRLEVLYLSFNQLTTLPPQIGNLINLQQLDLAENQLSNLPSEVGKLKTLCYFNLNANQLQYLPTEIAALEMFLGQEYCMGLVPRQFVAYGNPLVSPPPEVIVQGTAAILEYLRNEAWWHLQRLIAGGASGVGIVAAVVLGLRWRNRRGRKEKEKRGE
jgi:internalin A